MFLANTLRAQTYCKCFSSPYFTLQSGQKINRSTRRLLTPTVEKNITKQRYALSFNMTGLLQCFTGKPNTLLLFIAGLFTLCMTARIESHDSRCMGGRTDGHMQKCTNRGWGCGGGQGIRRTSLSWLWRVASRDLTPICDVSPSVSPSVSV